ncbi:HAD family hydrolase [Propionibacteriaceae bacterium Y1923]
MTQTKQTPVHSPHETWHLVDPRDHEVRLVVCDMDGTLLDESGRIPQGFAELIDDLDEAGISFVPASGRPYPTLSGMFTDFPKINTLVSENGCMVVREGTIVSMSTVAPADVEQIMDIAEQSGRDLGVILCGRGGAWVERTDEAFVEHVGEYFSQLTGVENLREIDDDILKVAIYDFGDPTELINGRLAPLARTHQVVHSAEHWIDIMAAGSNKGTAVQSLQDALGVTRAQTVAFGDYYNDAEMLDAADLSFAIGNAHPGIQERARYVAPTNAEQGVVTVLRHLLDRD